MQNANGYAFCMLKMNDKIRCIRLTLGYKPRKHLVFKNKTLDSG